MDIELAADYDGINEEFLRVYKHVPLRAIEEHLNPIHIWAPDDDPINALRAAELIQIGNDLTAPVYTHVEIDAGSWLIEGTPEHVLEKLRTLTIMTP